jgi:8-oxo-dGTP pyrophosphatase MutT (NUDIX family)
LVDELQHYQPLDDTEARHLQKIIELVTAHENIFDSTCQVGHITGSALVLDNHGRVLLHFHKRLNRWLQFGGHTEPHDISPAATAFREAMEDSGLQDLYFIGGALLLMDVDVHPIPAREDMPEHLHLDLRYLLGTYQPDAVRGSGGEATDFQWMTFDEALAMEGIDEGLRRLIRKAERYYTVF